ncbi:YwmB family TATA-box binding protein [Anaerosalibacter massiliensis]|uniref:YwmB family TATA-box binding protein n=1 Tax=Anaerosalibacter massiliensis TaxID=1347392 RepID=A0A9X2MGM4_9FIRM|nr:YwmB family TATA-box binding protein [Anaerosalibacter massiliensis]MCR2044707.1 YwmB family TATA-box binding protein [Anaerosalibacter massiliensis]
MKWFRNITFLGIIISLVLTNFSFSQDNLQGYNYQENILMDSIENMGADFIELDIHCSGKYKDEFISKEEIVLLGEELGEKLGILEDITGEIIEKEGFIQYNAKNSTEDLIDITISSYRLKNKDEGETTIFVNLVKREKNGQINDIMENTQDIFAQYGIQAEITTCIVGGFKGKLDRSDINKKIIKAIKRVNGVIVDNYDEENLVSITAYTPIFKNYIYSGNKKMNYNLAIRYNEYEDKTCVWIGTPIITISY